MNCPSCGNEMGMVSVETPGEEYDKYATAFCTPCNVTWRPTA